MQPYVIAKYREFQELSKDHKVKPATPAKEAPVRENKDAKVPALKIRISTRKNKKKNQDEDPDSDHEFEQILKAHERQLDEEEKAKEERRQSRRAAAAAKKAKRAEEVSKSSLNCLTGFIFRSNIKTTVKHVSKAARFFFVILVHVPT